MLVEITIEDLLMFDTSAYSAIPNPLAFSGNIFLSTKTGEVYWSTNTEYFKYDSENNNWEPWDESEAI